MLTALRVSELHAFLAYAGQSKLGKKPELLARAQYLIEKGASTPLQIKLRELYK